MKKQNLEYLTPEVEVIMVSLTTCIATSGNIEESGENPEVPWVI